MGGRERGGRGGGEGEGGRGRGEGEGRERETGRCGGGKESRGRGGREGEEGNSTPFRYVKGMKNERNDEKNERNADRRIIIIAETIRLFMERRERVRDGGRERLKREEKGRGIPSRLSGKVSFFRAEQSR